MTTALKTKTLLALTLLGFASCSYGQSYHYQFRLAGVTDLASAKQVTDVLRPVFNTEAAPFAVFPAFNDATDLFDFSSGLLVTQEHLTTVLTPKGLVLSDFSSKGPDQSSNSVER